MTTSTLRDVPAPTADPASPSFPVKWEDPAQATYSWSFNRAHAPEPILPVDAVFFHCAYEHGVTVAARAFELPFGSAARRINTYAYTARVPIPTPAEKGEAQAERSQQKLMAAMGRLAESWEGEYLPEIKRYLADWVAFDLRGATMPALLAHLDESIERTKRLYEIHMLIAFPFLTAISMFDDFYQDLFGKESAFDAYKLLQGFENKTVEGGRALWQLSRRALAQPGVREVLETQAATDVWAALERSASGREFLEELRAYLQAWGQRGDRWGWGYPSWIEDPTPAIKMLKDYVAQPERDLDVELASQVTVRERLIAETRERLQGYPEPVRTQFEFLLEAAQEATVLTEDHAFWIDFRCMYEVRRVMLEVGRRLAEVGVLDEATQVFYLTPDEMRETAEAAPRLDRRPLAAARHAEMEYYRTITPPRVLGAAPSAPPATTPLSIALRKFGGAPPPATDEPDVVRGNAGSPGIVRGRAKVVRSLAEAGKLEPGDVLVTEMTAPPWTPLFASVAAVVTDTGGILSHPAVVAREYGIPAVVGAGSATTRIRDGQHVEVDGTNGCVRILPAS